MDQSVSQNMRKLLLIQLHLFIVKGSEKLDIFHFEKRLRLSDVCWADRRGWRSQLRLTPLTSLGQHLQSYQNIFQGLKSNQTFLYTQRLHKDFPSLKDLTVKCCVRILMTGQIGWSPDGLRMNNGTKEIKTRERKMENSLVRRMNVVQTGLAIPPVRPHIRQ